jgi:hypothetical protein
MHLLFPFTLAALSLSASVPFLPTEHAVPPGHAKEAERSIAFRFGPPAICLPLEVGGRTLKWGEGALTPAKDYPLIQLRADLLALLETEDTLTRMENLRRTAIMLGPLHRTASSQEKARVRIDLLSSLRNRALRALLDEEANGYAAQCVFDLGYLQAALTQVDGRQTATATHPDFCDGEKELRYAAKILPQDGALALGLTLAVFDTRRGGADLAQFMRCAKLVGTDAMLGKNLKTAAHHFLAQADYDELVRSMAN